MIIKLFESYHYIFLRLKHSYKWVLLSMNVATFKQARKDKKYQNQSR